MRTFDQVFGPGHVFCPAAIADARRWLPPTPEWLTGGQLPFLGSMPCFCHASVASGAGLQHLSEVGHCLPAQMEIYRDDAGLVESLKQYSDYGWKIVATHLPYPPGFTSEAFWVRPELVSRLNNKQYLSEWVPASNLPQRIVTQPGDLQSYQGPFPVVVKVATKNTSGGGAGITRYADKPGLSGATIATNDNESLIIEQWLELDETWCLNFACYPDKTVEFLGAAQQIIDHKLAFRGNEFHSEKRYSHAMLELGEVISNTIASSGYYGIIGLDIGKTTEGRLYVFDINCRMNASTTPLIALEKFSWLKNYPLQRSVRLTSNSTLDDAIKISGKAFTEGRFLPLSTFDPKPTGLDGRPFVAGLLAGESETEITAYLDRQLR